jgi:hypothetical protein
MAEFSVKWGETSQSMYRRALRQMETSAWGKGGCVGRRAVPGATNAQLRAGALKLLDVALAHLHRGGKGSCIAA